jgi:hypothetical protein
MRYEETHWNRLTNNAHVILRKSYLLWIAEQERKHMAQLAYYTELMLEQNPEWRSEHILQDDFDYDYYSS